MIPPSVRYLGRFPLPLRKRPYKQQVFNGGKYDKMKKLYVGNLSYQTSENDLRQAFEKFGEVGQVSVITDRATGRSKGFGFVEMQDAGEADDAINALNGAELDNRTLTVNEARPQEQRSSGGGRGYNGGGRRY